MTTYSPVQQQAIDIRNKNVLVSASAGSGKTSVLVERLCRLVIDDQISIDSILAMTFTNDAASEMKSRLMASLQKAKQTDYVQNQLALLEMASICTIDSFCLSIVQNYYYKIPISLAMSKNTGDEAFLKTLLNQAYRETLEELDPKEYSKLSLYFQSLGKTEEDIQKAISNCINVAWSKTDPEKWILDQISDPVPEKIYAYFIGYFKENIQAMIEILDDIIDQVVKNSDLLNKQSELKKCLEFLNGNDYTNFKRQFIIYMNYTPKLGKTIEKINFEVLQKEFKNKEENIYNVLYDEEIYLQDYKNNQELLKVFAKIVLNTKKRFSALKMENEVIDFSDMEHFAHQLLQDPMISEELRNKYQTILVDEFQDTNDLQESIIGCFCRENNVFRVGDIKQSIYGFRQARPEIMLGHMEKEDEYSTNLVLDENYRSNASIVEFNNDFYNKIMNTSLFGHNFTQSDVARCGLQRQIETKQYPVRFLYTEIKKWLENNPEFSKTQANKLHKDNKIDMIAQDILQHIRDGFTYKDICILTRSHSPQEEIKKVLEAYGIPCLAEIDHGFYTNASIQIIVSTLNAIQNVEDDISLMACLCSPLFKITPEMIATSCINKEKNVTLYQQIKDEEYMESFNEVRRMKHKSIIEIVRYLYALNDFYFFHTTSQDKTNLDLFLEMANKFRNQANLKDFVDQIKQASVMDAVSEAYPFGKEADVVKIKTMHHSKGLQFPVVYVLSSHEFKDMNSSQAVLIDPDLGISFQTIDASRQFKRTSLSHIAFTTKKFHDEMKEEMRVLYVATTRPEKELILVDTIDSLEEYSHPLSTYTLLARNGYTGLLLSAYGKDPDSIVKFDRQDTLCIRPESLTPKSVKPVILPYQKETKVIENVTASSQKTKYSWSSLSLTTNSATNRGTLFHEMAGNLAYPYQKNDIFEYAKSYDYHMTNTDLDQFLSLNECEEYANMMSYDHKFELSYISRQDHQIAHGFMDLVVYEENRIVILDFKTDTVSSCDDLKEKYHLQLEMYKDSLQKMHPNVSIDTCIYSFHLKTLFYL